MSEWFTDSGFYNGNEVVMCKKGKTSVQGIRRKFQNFMVSRTSEPPPVSDNVKVFYSTQDLKKKLIKLDDSILDQTAEILSDIIFNSKKSPWWASVNALTNYVDWVYCHSIDVALLSLIMAIKSGLDSETQKEICLGALLHDIGKLLVPKDIIQKPGHLNEQEMMIVRQHCELGCSMLKENGLPDTCLKIILQHHERLDGSGYPYGLRSYQISAHAKIVMIADALDAITSYRPYKSVRDMHAGIEELKWSKKKFEIKYVRILEDCLQA